MIKFNLSYLFACLFVLSYSNSVFSQTLTLPLAKGGDHDGGTVLKVDLSNNSYVTSSFQGQPEATEIGCDNGTLLGGMYYESTNNSIYIVLHNGGRIVGKTSGEGAIYKYDIALNKVKLIKQFDSYGNNGEQGLYPVGSLVKVNNKLYGVTNSGGTSDKGVIYSIDISANDVFQIEHQFNGTTDGGNPTCALYFYNNLLYGAGSYSNGTDGFSAFNFDPSNQNFTCFYNATGSAIVNRGIFVRNNKLYVSRSAGIEYYDLLAGSSFNIWYIGFDVNVGSVAHGFTQRPSNGKWYTPFSQNGINGFGTIGEITTSASSPALATHQMQGGSFGEHPFSNLVNGLQNKMYGIAPTGSSNNPYIMYELSELDVYSVVHTFAGTDANSLVRLAPVLVGTKLIGIDEKAGALNAGSIWSFDLSNNQFSTLLELGFVDGRSPVNKLTDMGNGKSIGVTFSGTNTSRGAMYEYNNTDHSIRKICHIDSSKTFANWYNTFHYNNEFYLLSNINQSLIPTYNSPFVMAKIDTTTGNFSQITPINPGGSNLNVQYGNIVQDNNLLYGANINAIWKFDLATMTYTTLGSMPASYIPGGTYLKDSLLFIATKDANNNVGHILKINLNNNALSTIASSGTGSTYYSVIGDANALYAFETNNATEKGKIISFDYTNYSPSQLAIVDSATIGYAIDDAYLILGDGFLYGITTKGSDHGYGSIFKCQISNGQVSKVLALDRTTGYFPFRCEMKYNVASTTGINEPSGNKKNMIIYPNPAMGEVRFSIGKVDEIKVYTASGELYAEGTNLESLNTSNYANGIYLVKAMKNGEPFWSKMIK